MGIISPPAPKPYPNSQTVLILGSSTGAQFGASTNVGDPAPSGPAVYGRVGGYGSPPTGWGGLFTAGLKAKDPGWDVVNRSMSGTHTQNSIDRFKSHVAPYQPSHVILCTSIQNEPLIGTSDTAAVQTWLSNTRRLIGMCQLIGAQPIVASIYPRNQNTGVSYACALNANAQLEQLGVPVIDWMSAMDDGTGKFTGGTTYSADGTHATDAGQAIYFDAIDLSIFTQGFRVGPIETGAGAWKLTANGIAMPVVLSSPAKSFTMRAKFKSVSGVSTGSVLMGAMVYGLGNSPLRVRAPSNVAVLTDLAGNNLATSTYDITTDFNVHDLVLTYNAATGQAAFYLDGAQVGTSATPSATVAPTSTFGFVSRPDTAANAAIGMSISDVCVWRAPLSAEKIANLYSTGRVPSASLSFHGRLASSPKQIVPNSTLTDVLPLIGGASWAQVPAF